LNHSREEEDHHHQQQQQQTQQQQQLRQFPKIPGMIDEDMEKLVSYSEYCRHAAPPPPSLCPTRVVAPTTNEFRIESTAYAGAAMEDKVQTPQPLGGGAGIGGGVASANAGAGGTGGAAEGGAAAAAGGGETNSNRHSNESGTQNIYHRTYNPALCFLYPLHLARYIPPTPFYAICKNAIIFCKALYY